MARQLDYGFNDAWLNSKDWVAVSGEDFPVGEEEYFLIFLQSQANDHDLWAETRIKKMRYSGDVAVIFRFVERDEGTP